MGIIAAHDTTTEPPTLVVKYDYGDETENVTERDLRDDFTMSQGIYLSSSTRDSSDGREHGAAAAAAAPRG